MEILQLVAIAVAERKEYEKLVTLTESAGMLIY